MATALHALLLDASPSFASPRLYGRGFACVDTAHCRPNRHLAGAESSCCGPSAYPPQPASRHRRHHVAAAGRRLVTQEAAAPQILTIEAVPIAAPPVTPVWQNPVIVCMALAALLASFMLRTRKLKPAISEQPDLDTLDQSAASDPRAFQRSLARTRQAGHITKAVAFQQQGEPAKAYQELGRALHENSICRRPFNSGSVGRDELVKLYQLAVRCGEVPPHWATLLQLQELLGLSQEEAERLELEIVESSTSFSI